MTSILISHKLNELAKVADTITMHPRRHHGRDDRLAQGEDQRRPHHQEHGRARDVRPLSPSRVPRSARSCSRSENWRVEHPQHAGREVIKGVSLHVNKGEVVGIAGLMGAGRTELAMSVFGRAYGRNISGKAIMDGKEDRHLDDPEGDGDTGSPMSPRTARRWAWCSPRTSRDNITLANLPGRRLARRDRRGARAAVAEPLPAARCTSARRASPAGAINLSGGNQQKVVLSKWLFAAAGGADPRRADARHRRRREIRDLHHHQRTGRTRARA